MRRILAALALVTSAGPAVGWNLFQTAPSAVPQQAAPAGDAALCLREILAAQERYGIPDNMLLAIGLQEAGTGHTGQLTVWPWAVNAAGEGRLFESRSHALDWVALKRREGVDSIDLGCMQINMRWHPDAFDSVAEGFDPAVNVDYAARFLVRLHRQTGDWLTAAGSYHSFTPEKREIYLASLEQNVAVANARSASFHAMADRAPRQVAEAGLTPRAGIAWSSQLSGGRTSLYSSRELQPILPAFQRAHEGAPS
ncbi:transglycosylase SLT domain-containing protein [Histidinibacterium aquaticum]|uniref:Lytic transglycosylase domain-containing protein n=1 Tax=Histidinibacterium aquaticum TaxID=2613962 RepID=A0A5J5GP60_9RHOB|nr:transglycosylase SLT domain-containing protein [Histidinibacterium aquaticum]KAA9009950.1 lytic transglycosylase domain-containing protein [Histidinibacterium aquaticum]